MIMASSLLRLLLGRPLANREQRERKIGVFEAVPAMGLDGLGSSAYGPEAALAILAPLGVTGLGYIGVVMAPVLGLLSILYLSYRQTIAAYPSNGGAYTVSKANLGVGASLLAAAALMIDYVLNVAVGISAGVAALTSAVPMLHPHTLALCLAILAVITVVNLRGTIDAGRLFALPTYLFIASFVLLLAIGIFKSAAAAGHPQPVLPPPALPEATGAASLWLLLRAFSAGCTAMTGVEAISNGVSAFREPVVKHGRRTLAAVCAILGILLAGIAYLTTTYGIGAMDQTRGGYQSVLSQLAMAVAGRGWFYDVAMGSLLCVLCLSANTSFTGFPLLCRSVAQDDFLPRTFAVAGRRLVFSVGILYLAITSGLLLAVFGGITDRLIPLFAIGAFLTFTLSQIGMVAHWRRELREMQTQGQRRQPRAGLAINALGAMTTVAALVIIIAAKFLEGAWITIVVLPCVIVLLRSIKRYYERLAGELRDEHRLDLRPHEPPIIVVATHGWNRLTDKALTLAIGLSRDVFAAHLTKLEGPDADAGEKALRQKWSQYVEDPAREAGVPVPRLVVLQAPYRRIHVPLLEFVDALKSQHPGRVVAVLIPEVVKRRWWQHLLHTHHARRLRDALRLYGGSGLVVISAPWYLDEPQLEEACVAEERLEMAGNRPAQRQEKA
jgi:amino acid transporter